MNIFLFLKFFFRLVKYYLSSTKRYAFLLQCIYKKKPKSIIEIGVYNGKRAIEMIETAKIFNDEIVYYGFDLFEDFYKKKNLLKKELSKNPLTKKQVLNKLKRLKNINLIKGDTKLSLPKFIKSIKDIDFVFIDGGHSFKTIKNDWRNVSKILKESSVVVFDDYYEFNNKKKLKIGCNDIINALSKQKYISLKYKIGDTFFDRYNKTYKKIFMVSVKKNVS